MSGGKHLLGRPKRHIFGTAKVGEKGQIVIPKDARTLFGIQPGDSLILLADKKQGIAIQHLSIFSKIADAIFSGHAKEIYPDHTEDASRTFAQAIKELETEEGEDAP